MTSEVSAIDVTRWTGCTRPAWDFIFDRWACGCAEPPIHGYDDDVWLFIREFDPGRVLRSEVT